MEGPCKARGTSADKQGLQSTSTGKRQIGDGLHGWEILKTNSASRIGQLGGRCGVSAALPDKLVDKLAFRDRMTTSIWSLCLDSAKSPTPESLALTRVGG